VSAAATGALKLRLERLKRLSNLRLEFMKRLYDWRPIVEQYLQGNCELHVHFLTGNGMLCARYRPREIEEAKSFSIRPKPSFESSSMENEVSVFVGIGDIPQYSRPIASSIRLQILDNCYMSGIEAIEPSALFPPLESLFYIFDRK
jgi:hypothetical protein